MGMAALVLRAKCRICSIRFLWRWGAVYASLVGVFAAVLELGLDVSSVVKILLLVSAAVISTGYALYGSRPKQIPPEILPDDEYAASECFTADCVDDRERAKQANEIATQIFTDIKPLPVDRYEQWMMVNPHILTCLCQPNGRVVGYFDVYPLEHGFMDRIIEGRCGEHDIRREHILSPEKAALTDRIYLAGVVAVGENSAQRNCNACRLIWALVKYLQHFYPSPPHRELFAAAATPEGARILEKFRFKFIADAKDRKDPYPLYSIVLTPEVYQAMLMSMPDWSTKVRLCWLTREKEVTSNDGK
jgi:hypothetical protein